MKLLTIAIILFLIVGCKTEGNKTNTENMEKNMMFVKKGYVKISGGCEVYATGEIIFNKKNHNKIEITIKNGGYFYNSTNKIIGDFKTIVSEKELQDFSRNIKKIIDNPELSKGIISTKNIVIEIYLRFEKFEIKELWKESDDKYNIDILNDEIEKFVKYLNTSELAKQKND
jgi:hypothetical protein